MLDVPGLVDRLNFLLPFGRWQLFEISDLWMYLDAHAMSTAQMLMDTAYRLSSKTNAKTHLLLNGPGGCHCCSVSLLLSSQRTLCSKRCSAFPISTRHNGL